MRQFLFSLAFIVVFGTYALNQTNSVQSPAVQAPVVVATAPAVAQPAPVKLTKAKAVSKKVAAPPPQKAPSVAQPVTPPVARAQGTYRDGTYTGTAADAHYGTVQVQVMVAGGKIADVAFLNYPQGRGTSVRINSFAMPQLTQEAIAAQSAQVNGVSGASATSAAFRQSLASALAQAKA